MKRTDRERGSALILAIFFLIIVTALASVLCTGALTNAQAVSRSMSTMRAYYLADAGLQIAQADLHAASGEMLETIFSENLAGGDVAVHITPLGSGLYRITSTGTLPPEQQTLELHVQFTPLTLGLDSAIQLSIGPDVSLVPNLYAVDLENESHLSGLDHAPDGTALVDQSSAVYGIGVNDQATGDDFAITTDPSSSVEGIPTPTTTAAQDIGPVLAALRDHASTAADVTLSGGQDLKSNPGGIYGTPTTPKLVYVHDLGPEGMLHMSDGFTGYGTLVIDVQDTHSEALLNMKDHAKWYGLILVSCQGNTTPKTLLRLQDQCEVTGGLTVLADGAGVILDPNQFFHVQNQSKVSYSSELVASAPGLSALSGSSATVQSYRRILPSP